VTGANVRRGSAAGSPARAVTLIWIDAREASVVRWVDGAAVVRQLVSDVPAHRRSTGHVRHHPDVRHGGGGSPQTAGEPRRLEHLARFLDAVAEVPPDEDDLLVLGPGTVQEHLAAQLRERDRHRHIIRDIDCEPAARLSRRQLVARLRRAIGEEPPRGAVRGHRRTPGPGQRASGRRMAGPARREATAAFEQDIEQEIEEALT
jgi:hypothetical protein